MSSLIPYCTIDSMFRGYYGGTEILLPRHGSDADITDNNIDTWTGYILSGLFTSLVGSEIRLRITFPEKVLIKSVRIVYQNYCEMLNTTVPAPVYTIYGGLSIYSTPNVYFQLPLQTLYGDFTAEVNSLSNYIEITLANKVKGPILGDRYNCVLYNNIKELFVNGSRYTVTPLHVGSDILANSLSVQPLQTYAASGVKYLALVSTTETLASPLRVFTKQGTKSVAIYEE